MAWLSDRSQSSLSSHASSLVPGAWIPSGSKWGTQPAWLDVSTGPTSSTVRDVDVLVIGAGQAGLAAAHELHRAGMRGFADGTSITGVFQVLDAEVRPGGAWQHRWPTLTMSTINAIADLPGLTVGNYGADEQASHVIPDYFASYEETFDLPILRPVLVHAVHRHEGRYFVETTGGTWRATAIINCTGTWTRPFIPFYPGRDSFAGVQLHTQDYRGPAQFQRRRVAVVGGGISATQHLAELAPVAKSTAWFTRREPEWIDTGGKLTTGREVEASVRDRVEKGLRPLSVVAETGLLVTDSVRQALDAGVLVRKPMFTRIEPDGVVQDSGKLWRADVILWATGFRSELRHLAPLKLRTKAGGFTMRGTAVAGEPTLHLIGYGPTASTIGARWGARKAVRQIKDLLEIS